METKQFPWNEWQRPPRIALLLLGHRDYPLELALPWAEMAQSALTKAHVHVLFSGRAYTDAVSAGAAARALLKKEPDGFIILPGTWLEGDTALAALREIEPLPFVLWGVPMFAHQGRRESTGSFVAACSLKGPLEQMGYRFSMHIGLPQEPTIQHKLLIFARAARARQLLKRTRLGLMGYVAMSIYAGTFHHLQLRRLIGPEIVHLDTSSLLREMEHVDAAAARSWLQPLQKALLETNETRLLQAGKMAEALQRLSCRHHLHGLNVKCQYELSQEYGLTPCLPLALLADTGLLASCEGDMMAHVAQAILQLLSGHIAPYADLLDLQAPSDNHSARPVRALFSACGFAPLSLRHEEDPCRICEFEHPGFSGLICAFTLRRGPVTLLQLSEQNDRYRLLYGTGQSLDTPLRQGRFPALAVELDCTASEILAKIKSQHFAFCYGDVTEELQQLATLLGLQTESLGTEQDS